LILADCTRTLAAMRIQFCGANRAVTGSCHLVEVNGLRILLDMGMFQGPRELSRRLNLFVPPELAKIDAVILSHGHLDHCGRLPVLIRHGYTGPIFCTPATADVARVVLEDAAEVQEEDAIYLNRRSRDPDEPEVQPLYRSADVPGVLRAFREISYGHTTAIGNDVAFTFYDAGHILGSAYVVLEWRERGRQRRLLFTADIGRYNTPIIRDPVPPPANVDMVITESTYGGRTHEPIDLVEKQLLDAVHYCVEHRSRLIVPAFAVGRTQTMLWYVQKLIDEKRIPAMPVFVDSPMGVEISRIHSEHRDNYDEQTREMIGQKDLFGLSRVTFARSGAESRQINGVVGPCVIIASSPTCEFGRVLHHVKVSVERQHDMILFVGYTPPNTLGARLQKGDKRVRIYDRWYDVRCQVRTLHGLSAHADATELLRFLRPAIHKQTEVHIVHGDADQAEALAARLIEQGIENVMVPAMETSVYCP
jgi:metallo-beta-lactamase family protein